MEYYRAAETLFREGAEADWIKIILNIIVTHSDPDEIISFIEEVVYAFNNDIKSESIASFIDHCDKPVELHAFCDDIIHVANRTWEKK